MWSHLLAFQLECEELEDEIVDSQDTNSLSPSAGMILVGRGVFYVGSDNMNQI